MTHNDYKNLSLRSDRFQACGISHPGQKRSANEDSILLDEAGSFVLLADGMGGHERGGEASSKAVDVIRRCLSPDIMVDEMQSITDGAGLPVEVACMLSMVDNAVRQANTEIYNINRRENLQRFMGTTIAGLAVVSSGFVIWFHVGDSRIYRWRDGRLTRLTVDHSALVDWERGGKRGDPPRKNIITRAIGPSVSVDVEMEWEPLRREDFYLLCSDGLSDMITENEIGAIFSRDRDVETIARNLVEAANAAGGKDNISAVVCST